MSVQVYWPPLNFTAKPNWNSRANKHCFRIVFLFFFVLCTSGCMLSRVSELLQHKIQTTNWEMTVMLDFKIESYVYWTVHHLDSWIKRDQLDVTCFIISLFTAQHVSDVNTSIFRSLRLIVDLFHVLYCSGSMCVGVTVWFGWGVVVSLWRLRH